MAEKKTEKKKRKTRSDSTAHLPKHDRGNIAFVKQEGVLPGDNAKIMELGKVLFLLPEISIKNTEEVARRIGDFFDIYQSFDLKPTVSGFALCLGLSRPQLVALARGTQLGNGWNENSAPKEVVMMIKKAYRLLEQNWESNMLQGKINPVTGIFLAKNNYGYEDKIDHSFSESKETDDYSVEDIKKRYTTIDIDPE